MMDPNPTSPNPFRAAALVLSGAAVLLAGAPAWAQNAAPSLNQVFDSAAVAAELRALPAPPAGTEPLFTAVFVRGELKVVQPLVEETPKEYAAPVAALLQAQARALPAGDELRHVYVRAEGGASPRLSLYNPVHQAPRPANLSRVQRTLQEIALRERRLRGAEDPGSTMHVPQPQRQMEMAQLQIRMRVNTDGSSSDHVLMRASDNPRINREALRVAQQLRFEPGTVDGRVVCHWVILPVNVQY